MDMGVWNVTQHLAGSLEHFIGDIDSMNFAEMTTHGSHEASGAATDLKSAARSRIGWRQINHFTFEQSGGTDSAGQEFLLALAPPFEGYVIERVFARASVPIGAHLFV